MCQFEWAKGFQMTGKILFLDVSETAFPKDN
jgi:hypothetical protein